MFVLPGIGSPFQQIKQAFQARARNRFNIAHQARQQRPTGGSHQIARGIGRIFENAMRRNSAKSLRTGAQKNPADPGWIPAEQQKMRKLYKIAQAQTGPSRSGAIETGAKERRALKALQKLGRLENRLNQRFQRGLDRQLEALELSPGLRGINHAIHQATAAIQRLADEASNGEFEGHNPNRLLNRLGDHLDRLEFLRSQLQDRPTESDAPVVAQPVKADSAPFDELRQDRESHNWPFDEAAPMPDTANTQDPPKVPTAAAPGPRQASPEGGEDRAQPQSAVRFNDETHDARPNPAENITTGSRPRYQPPQLPQGRSISDNMRTSVFLEAANVLQYVLHPATRAGKTHNGIDKLLAESKAHLERFEKRQAEITAQVDESNRALKEQVNAVAAAAGK